MKQHLKIWEISLLLALCITLLSGMVAQAEQRKLAGELVRLHVIANSDSESDQSAKLIVRDSVLSELAPMLEGINNLEEAENVILKVLPDLCFTARNSLMRCGKYYPVAAKLCLEKYPTRYYDTFALPSGEYISLQIILGEGKGTNWWCVVFPPLCMTLVEREDAFSVLSENSAKLITSEGSEYKLKFRIIELYDDLKNALS